MAGAGPVCGAGSHLPSETMAIEASDPLIIRFGVDQWSREAMAAARDSLGKPSVVSPFPCAVIDTKRREPLRLNNSSYALAFKPPEEADRDPVANLRDCIKLECDPWNRTALDFLDGYFAALERHAVAEEAAIAAEAIGYGRLFDRRDWIFSALRPLPRAHLPIGDKYFRTTFAFWTGVAFIAVDLDAGDVMPNARRERESLFREAEFVLVTATPRSEAGWRDFLEKLGPPDGLWQGEALPLGPFRSTALDALFDQ
jgi:hypothetical protein